MTMADWDRLHKAIERAEKADAITDDQERRAEQRPLIDEIGNLRNLARFIADLDYRVTGQRMMLDEHMKTLQGTVKALDRMTGLLEKIGGRF